jgi:hypothetical protein
MKPNPFPMVHIHLEIERATWNALKKMHPGYGELSQVVRQLLNAYVVRGVRSDTSKR